MYWLFDEQVSQVKFFFVKLSTGPLDLIHFDLWGPSPIISCSSIKYYNLFIDYYSKFTSIFLYIPNLKFFSVSKILMLILKDNSLENLQSWGVIMEPNMLTIISKNMISTMVVHQTLCLYTPSKMELLTESIAIS